MGPPNAFASTTLGPVALRNRVIKAATFEGVMPNGEVTDDLIAFHAEVAHGGAALTTVAYMAVADEGRVNRHTIRISEQHRDDLKRLSAGVHAHGAKISGQLGHAGFVANQQSNKLASLGPSRRLSAPALGLVRAASQQDIERIVRQFADAALVLEQADFDVIEIHLGHNYLLSSFMSPNLNKRSDGYGGSIENRLRFAREVCAAVKTSVGDTMGVIAKFNMVDGVERGLWLDESIQMAQILEADGHLDALELTGGSSLLNGMYFFRGDVPLAEFRATQPPMVSLGMRFFGSKIFPHYPFEEAFFLGEARQFRDALNMPLILLGGINKRSTIDDAMAQGFEFVAMGRAILRDPYVVGKLRDDEATSGLCIHCNKCLPTIYSGTRCVLRE